MMRRLPVLLISMLGVGTASAPLAQAPDPDVRLKFEVASIKPNTLGSDSFLWAFRNGRFTARYVTLKALIRSAYGRPELVLTERQVIGGPRWLDSERFDVEAIAPNVPNSPRGTFSAPLLRMLSRLLEERFALEAHVETREFPLFAIVLARKDGRLGPGMRRRAQPCTAATVDAPGDPISLGTSTRQTCRGSTGPGSLVGTGLTMSNLASGLSQFVAGIDRIVVDRTGLSETFDVELHWQIESSGAASQPGAVLLDLHAPSLFTALEEQLGLRLERTNGPMDALVIDHVEPLTAN